MEIPRVRRHADASSPSKKESLLYRASSTLPPSHWRSARNRRRRGRSGHTLNGNQIDEDARGRVRRAGGGSAAGQSRDEDEGEGDDPEGAREEGGEEEDAGEGGR